MLCEISDREEANTKSGQGEFQQQNKTEPLQFDIECLQRENAQLRAEVGRIYGLFQASETALKNVKTDTERQHAELSRKDDKIKALKSFIRSLRSECLKVETDTERQRAELSRKDDKIKALKSFIRSLRSECNNHEIALQNLELDNSFLRAELRRDARKISLQRRSILKLTAKVSRGKLAKARLAVLRGALNVLTDGNYLPALSLHLSGNLHTRVPGNRRRQVGEWLNEAYALCLREELDSGESTEEMDSSEDTD